MSTDGLIRLLDRHMDKVYSENLIDISDRIGMRFYPVRDADRLKALKKLEKEDKEEVQKMSYDNIVNVLKAYQEAIKDKDKRIQELIEEVLGFVKD